MRTKFGQNFLVNNAIADKIVQSLQINANDTIIEIGPGKGILTSRILTKKPEKLIAIELDRNLISNLIKKFGNDTRIELLNTDFMDYDLSRISSGTPVKFIANLPYYISTVILNKVLSYTNWDISVFMFQKEVADRILAKPDNKQYGILTLITRLHVKNIELIIPKISPDSFSPSPEIYSSVLQFTKIEHPYTLEQISKFTKFVQASFQSRRKTIANCLSKTTKFTKQEIIEILNKNGISSNSRPENITFQQYMLLSNILV